MRGFRKSLRISLLRNGLRLSSCTENVQQVVERSGGQNPEPDRKRRYCNFLHNKQNKRYYGNLNISFSYVEGESLIMAIKEMAVSSGSACTSASLEPSYVLRALGVNEENAHSSLRIGIGRFTTEEEIEYTIEKLSKSVKTLREMSPLWEMV